MPSRQANTTEGIESFQLPKALVTRIAKSNLPGETKFQKDTVNALVDSATVFINFLAATAHEVTNSKSRKIITAPDVLQALELIDLSDLVPLLENELELYRGTGKGDRSKASVTAETKRKGKEKEAVSEAIRPDEGADEGVPVHTVATNELEEEEEEGDDQEQQEIDLRDGEEEDDAMEEDNAEPDDDEPEDEEEPEELVDTMAVEDEEVRKDNQGLEESNDNGE